MLYDGTAELEWTPMRPGTLRGWINTGAAWEDGQALFDRLGARVFINDDGDGNLIVEGKLAATINYLTGHMVFPAEQFKHSEYLLEYFFDSQTFDEKNKKTIHVLNMVSDSVQARWFAIRSKCPF